MNNTKFDGSLFNYEQIYEDHWNEEERIFYYFEERLKKILNNSYMKFFYEFEKEKHLFLSNFFSYTDLLNICQTFNRWIKYLQIFSQNSYQILKFAKKMKFEVSGMRLFQKTRKFCIIWAERFKKYDPEFTYNEYQKVYYKKSEEIFNIYCLFMTDLAELAQYIDINYNSYLKGERIGDFAYYSFTSYFVENLKYLNQKIKQFKEKKIEKTKKKMHRKEISIDNFLEK